jgi:hypothetical protein
MKATLTIVSLLFSVQTFAATINDLSLLHGCWRGDTEFGVYQESYSKVTGGQIFDYGQVFNKELKNEGWGASVISQKGDGIEYGYSDSGSAYEMFQLVSYNSASEGNFVAEFVKPDGQKVSKVTYTVTGNTTLTILLNGQPPYEGMTFNLKRTSNEGCN